CERAFYKIDRPLYGITLKKIIKGLIALRREFQGKIWLEIMLVGGINDSLKEAQQFKALIAKIKPDKAHLNIPVRPSGAAIELSSANRVAMIKKILGPKAEITGSFAKRRQKYFSGNSKEAILNFLTRRPANLKDLCAALGIGLQEARRALGELTCDKKITQTVLRGKGYFTVCS
ncbi:MAG: hypothetical protein KKF80_06470, partial [Candidatus Omnitrophica bacterium]|nr:hypothetical protein [Candidatus Omnitrophota bacterium]